MHPSTLIATVGGVGFIRRAPGTFGSLAGVLLALPIFAYGGLLGLFAATLVVFVAGTKAADAYEARTGRHDPREIVIDEVVGQWLTLLLGLVGMVIVLEANRSFSSDTLAGFEPGLFGHVQSVIEQLGVVNQIYPHYILQAVQHPFGIFMLSGVLVVPFAMFRLFDIWKPGFIGHIDRKIQGGFGTMLDDALAGLLAGVATAFLWSAPLIYLILHAQGE